MKDMRIARKSTIPETMKMDYGNHTIKMVRINKSTGVTYRAYIINNHDTRTERKIYPALAIHYPFNDSHVKAQIERQLRMYIQLAYGD